MNIALRVPTSLDEFLAWEEREELRYEFDGVRAIAMVGGTWAHGQICVNIVLALRTRLRAGCSVSVHDSKLRLARSIRYPDVMVVCSPVANSATYVTDPVVVFEVLSESTSATDRVIKCREYGEVSSIARYVIVEQTAVAATVFSRPDWRGLPLSGPDTRLSLPEIGVDMQLAECYAGIDLGSGTLT